MTPTRKPLLNWPLVVTYLVLSFVLSFLLPDDLSVLLSLSASVILYAIVRYLWCATEAHGPAHRTIAAGDPRPWQLWRWMDIYGPTAHAARVHEELYLRRLYVLRTPWFGVMLHWIKREDWDRDALHNHPWTFYRLILSGGYVEEVAYPIMNAKGEVHPMQHLNTSKMVTHRWLRASKFPTGAYHRITSVKPRTVSFVINGPKKKSWGFFVPGTGKVGWKDYVDGAR